MVKNEEWADLLIKGCRDDNQKQEINFGDRYEKDLRGIPCSGVTPIPAGSIRRAILEEAKASQAKRDFRVRNGLIADTLHLEHIQFRGYLRFENCRFKGRIDLRHARLRRLKFQNCIFEEIFEADVADVDGDVEIKDCTADRGLVFRAAHVGGRFVVAGTEIDRIRETDRDDVTTGAALDAAMVHADHGLSFRPSENRAVGVSGSRATKLKGILDLTSAFVGGHLEFIGASISSCEDQPAVDMTNATVDGFFFIRGNTKISGKLNLFSSKIRLFSIRESEISCGSARDEAAIDAEEISVSTSFTVGDGATVEGLNLNSARIGGVFQFGGRADESGKAVPDGGKQQKVVTLTKKLNLTHATISRLSIDFSRWLECCRNGNMVPFLNGCIYDDIVSINGSDSARGPALRDWILSAKDEDRGGRKDDAENSWWVRVSNIFSISTGRNYHPQVYHHLIAVLRSKGREREVRAIDKLGAKHSTYAKYNGRFFLYYIVMFAALIRKFLVGYNNSIVPLLLSSIIYIYAMSVFYYDAFHEGYILPAIPVVYTSADYNVSPPSAEIAGDLSMGELYGGVFEFQRPDYFIMPKEYSDFHPLWYSLDVFLPIFSISQEDHWAPITVKGDFSLLWFLYILQVGVGWIFSGLLVTSITSGIIKRKD